MKLSTTLSKDPDESEVAVFRKLVAELIPFRRNLMLLTIMTSSYATDFSRASPYLRSRQLCAIACSETANIMETSCDHLTESLRDLSAVP